MRALLVATVGLLAPHAAPWLNAAAAPATPLPSLPSLSRVRLEVGKERSLLLYAVNLPRGDYAGGDLDLYVSFGATLPSAVDARVLAVPDGELEAPADDPGESVVLERAPRKPATAHLLVGRASMAGVVVKLKEAAFRRATSPGRMAELRVREVLPIGDGARPLPVRLGVVQGQPITVLRLEISAQKGDPPLERSDARFCGPDADPTALTVFPRARGSEGATVLPFLATRHATDDLCFDWSR